MRIHNDTAPDTNAEPNHDVDTDAKPQRRATPRPTTLKHNNAVPDAEPRTRPNNAETDNVETQMPVRQLNPNTDANVPEETIINTDLDPAIRRQTQATLNPDPASKRKKPIFFRPSTNAKRLIPHPIGTATINHVRMQR